MWDKNFKKTQCREKVKKEPQSGTQKVKKIPRTRSYVI